MVLPVEFVPPVTCAPPSASRQQVASPPPPPQHRFGREWTCAEDDCSKTAEVLRTQWELGALVNRVKAIGVQGGENPRAVV